MSRLIKWGLPTLVILVPLALVGLPTLAQDYGQQPGKHQPGPVNVDVERAKEMAALIQQGQLNLRDASAMAEKHCKGTALEAKCEIQRGEPRQQPKPPEQPKPRGPSAQEKDKMQKEPSTGNRLLYEVSCFAQDKLVTVRIDGLTKAVIDVMDHK